MKPEVDQILQFGAGHLMASIAPLLPPGMIKAPRR